LPSEEGESSRIRATSVFSCAGAVRDVLAAAI
jgi:hypothetical protein